MIKYVGSGGYTRRIAKTTRPRRLNLEKKSSICLHGLYFSSSKRMRTSCFLAGYDFAARFDPITLQVAPHIAGSNSHPGVSTDAFRFAGIRRAVDIEGFWGSVDRISREPNRSAHALTIFAKGFHARIFIALEGVERRSCTHIGSMLSLWSLAQEIYRQVRESELTRQPRSRQVDNCRALGQA